MLPTLDPERMAVPPGQALAVLAQHDSALPREVIWAHWKRLIARVARVQPESLHIARTAHGKPMLTSTSGLWFNVSYAACHSLLALSRRTDLGCDVEDRLVVDDSRKLAPLVLHPNEAAAINALDAHERHEAFARCWVRKEAVLKAIGTGFGEDPRGFDVRPMKRTPGANCAGWQLHDLPRADIAATVAARDEACVWFALQVSP